MSWRRVLLHVLAVAAAATAIRALLIFLPLGGGGSSTTTTTSTGAAHLLPGPIRSSLERTVQQLVARRASGILAADESVATFGKRLATLHMDNSPANRRQWREILFSAPGLQQHIAGVILHEETLSQVGHDGAPLPQLLLSRGLLVGIKVDLGTAPLGAGAEGETYTQGLEGLDGADGLAARCREYRAAGASFAKWRAVFRVGRGAPSRGALRRNAEDLAAYAAVCQRCGLVPILEPEVLAEGDHTLRQATQVSEQVLRAVLDAVARRRDVDCRLLLLKVAMVTPGRGAAQQATPQEVAAATLSVLSSVVPDDIPAIYFLSGGQSEEQATEHLQAISHAYRQQRKQ